MVSIIVLTRNAPHYAGACLQSLRACEGVLRSSGTEVEFILADDCSDAPRATLPALRAFRDSIDARTTIVRFIKQQHYSHGLGYTLSLARGERVVFVSQDMTLPPDCLQELLEISNLDASLGVIRPVSPHMDWADALAVAAPAQEPTFVQTLSQGAEVRRKSRGVCTAWPMLIGDAMCLSRSVLDRIGVFDPRFYGFFGDLDFGVRLHRAGFRHVIARGAWLFHAGNGTARETASSGGSSTESDATDTVQLAEQAYEQFREKWSVVELPESFRKLRAEHFDALHKAGPIAGGDFQPPMQLSADVAEVE